MSTFRLYFRALFGTFFLKVFLEKNCNGNKDPCAVFGCNKDRLFPEKYTVKNHTFNTKLEKGNSVQRRFFFQEYRRTQFSGLFWPK